MAEEEVLNEQIVASKGDRGGIPPIMFLGVLGGLSIVIIVLLFLMMGKTNQIKDLSGKLDKIQQTFDASEAGKQERVNVKECEKVFDLTPSKPLIINLSDGHYISTKLSICIDEKKVSEEELKGQVAPIIYIVQSSLMRLNKSDIFPEYKPDCGNNTATQTAPQSEGGFESLSSGDMGGEGGKYPDANLNKIRGRLLEDLTRNREFIVDVYPYEFVVD